MKTVLLIGLIWGSSLTVGQVAQAAADPGISQWVDLGSTAFITGMLGLTWKGLFIDQRWVPARDAEHDAQVERKLDRIIGLLGQDPDEP